MNPDRQFDEVQSPAQRAEILATLACVGCLVYLFSVGGAALDLVPIWWAKVLISALIPLALTFTILYGSNVHREMRRLVRTLFLLLNSVLIFGAACLSLAGLAFLICVFMPLSRFHY